MNADDLGRMLGWEFSLMTATVRLINSGLLDELPDAEDPVLAFLRRHRPLSRPHPRLPAARPVGHGGQVPRHGRRPQQPFEHYLDHRLFYDCAGWAAPDPAAELGADWVRYGMQEVALSQVVFATDYPQAVRDDREVADYVDGRARARRPIAAPCWRA